jgi:hypothetical protein
MTRFLRENAELIITICVVLSLILGGTLLWLKKRAETVPDPVEISSPVQAPVTAPVTDLKTDKAKH